MPVSCYGIAVHSGETVQLTLKPANAGCGIVFSRVDLSENNFIEANYNNVTDTLLSTTIANCHKVSVSTIEHLMAAIWGSGIDNIIIEIDGPEVPIMDGSSQPFVFMLECAGLKILNTPKKILRINKEVYVSHKNSEVVIAPSNNFQINLEIDFESKAIGHQSINFSNQKSFANDISKARTFGFIEELEYLRANGLAKGASLENAIGIDKDTILNEDGLRYKDEFVRHKLLDAIGDYATASCNILGSITTKKPGHLLNNLLMRKIFSCENNYSYITSHELNNLSN